MGKVTYTSAFKSRIVLELLKEEKQIGELSLGNNVNPNLLRNWRKEFLEKAPHIFDESKREKELVKREKELETERGMLLETIGQLTMESDWLKKKSAELYGTEYESRYSRR